VVFDKSDRTYHPGDEVVGAAKVIVNKDIKCDKIFLRIEWRTHGRGNRAKGGREDLVLSEGMPLRAGEEQLVPFRFTIPDGPLTYHGNYLNVDWYARLQVDVPWAIDPKQDEEFIVVENPADTGRVLTLGDPKFIEFAKPNAAGMHKTNMSEKFLSIFGLFFMLPGLIAMTASILWVKGFAKIGVFFFGLIFAAVGGAVVFWGLKNGLAKKKIGEVSLEVDPMELKRGKELSVRIGCNPADSSVVDNISSVLTCKEVVVSGSGTNQTTHTHVVFEDVQGQQPMNVVGVRGAMNQNFTHTIPESAPYSFWAASNSLRWSVVVRISIKGWPDWSETRELSLIP
jgi:hypothetical protein